MNNNQNSSTIDSVTIYREGAVCLRKVNVSGADSKTIYIPGLPLAMDAPSLCAYIPSGVNKVIGIGTIFNVRLVDDIDVPAEKKALDCTTELLSGLNMKLKRMDRDITELQAMTPQYLPQKEGDPPRNCNIQSHLGLADFVNSQLGAILDSRRELVKKITDAEQELTLRKNRLKELNDSINSDQTQITYTAVITLADIPKDGFEIELEYRIPGVKWVPLYQLRLENDMKSGALLMRAAIFQQSGEVWDNVKLSLSTASLDHKQDIPELRSLRIGRSQPPLNVSGWREPPEGLDALFSDYDAFTNLLAGQSRNYSDQVTAVNYTPPPPPSPVQAMSFESAPSCAAPVPLRAAKRSAAPLMAKSKVCKEAEDVERCLSTEEESAVYDVASSVEIMRFQMNTQMDYARLVMSGPDNMSSRGHLQIIASVQTELIRGYSLNNNIVVDKVNVARGRAVTVPSAPKGTYYPSSVDSFDYCYDCCAPATIASSGKWTTVTVMSCQIDFNPKYQCVPSVDDHVFRTLQIVNKSAYALFPGPVDVSLGDKFLMSTDIPAIAPHATAPRELGLGVEESIKIKRETHFNENSAGLLSGTTLLQNELDIEINNLLRTTADIEILERVPWVETDYEKIAKVEELKIQPPWDIVDTPINSVVLKGIRRWKVSVSPGERAKLSASFTIRIPSDKMLDGGNRRI
jgi:Domain of unknown function (DUF4139)